MSDYYDLMWAEMKPDCYGGEGCDEIVPRWWCYADGDMDAEHTSDNIVLDPKLFPPGTKITVTVPCCPECSQAVELCKADEFCDFDWDNWTLNQYS